MNRKRALMLSGAMVASVLCVGGSPAHAHGGPDHGSSRYAAIQGTLTLVSAGTIQIQHGSESATVALTGSTHVLRVVTGSLADLKIGQQVRVQMSHANLAVDSIVIEMPGQTVPVDNDHAGSRGTPRAPRTPLKITTPQHGGHGGNSSHPAEWGGQVVALTGSSITVRDPHGKTSTYALAQQLTVIKYLSGRSADLMPGETVRVDRTSTGSAATVTILQG